ncbi:MurR/RpiR family transcriptional regulator [Devosia sp. YIM 151766]|uniref:MurR/RpiR family transcriptional regulator n=1 Tax=Devosia sp. YIM 151766 TaxID=3017325 RepID=UPI00255C4712|nr:MurR/RpiR family transcriptional regulator [Devosia sp. YIM 151766]WIY53251.1 MurR/RpiR family transcriptional regulator [Devosia sp. YIM 151766]
MSAREIRPDLLERLQIASETLANAELEVARTILADPDWVSRSSIKALAAKAGVSEPTVIRLARKLGCSGYSDFKLRLAEDLVVTRMFLSPDALVRNSQPASIAERMYEAATRTMTEAMAMLNEKAFENAVKLLSKARRVQCFGVGGSSAIMAQEAENRLFRLGVAVQACADPYKSRMIAAIMAPEDVLLCFSATGKPVSVIDSAEIARANGVKVIAVTPAGSALSEVADVTLAVSVFNDEVYFNLPSPTRYAQLYLLDCLAAAMAVELGPHSFQNLKNIRRTLSGLHGTMKFQPIGD